MTTWTTQSGGTTAYANARGFRWDTPGCVWDGGIKWDSAQAATTWSAAEGDQTDASWAAAPSPTD